MDEEAKRSVEKVANAIEASKKEILALYEKKLKEQIEVSSKVSENLIGVIPQQIDNLIQILVRYSTSKKAINTLAQEHAKLRASNKVFTLDALIAEFIILRDVIFEILGQKGPLDEKASSIIWQFIVNSIKVAVFEFEIERKNEADQMKQDLLDSDLLNKDISAQVQSSNENEERYRTLVEGVDDYAVFTTDPNGYITTWNPGAERIKGYTPAEAIGSHFSMLYPEDAKKRDEPMHHLHVALIEGRFRGEGLRKRKNEELFLADVYIRPIFKDKKHLGFAKVVSDLTERSERLQTANVSNTLINNLKSEKELREKFVLTLSHDLRGPLTVARAAVELAGRYLEVDHKSRKFVEKALVSVDRVNKMIGDLLDANRIVSGEKPNLHLLTWDIVRLTENVCEDFRMLGARVELHTEYKELFCDCDGEGVRRILENLITNALKYGDNSFPVDVSILDLDDQICLKVHNMGEVIKTSDQESLFDQFRRTDSSLRKKGWGIGLSLVKGITEAHGGSVEVESYPIEGTTFTINLPRRATDTIAKQKNRPIESSSSPPT